MTTRQDLNTQIADAERRKRDAEQAERQRIEAEQTNLREIAATKQEISDLLTAKSQARELELRSVVQQAAAVNREAVNAFFSRLDEITAQLAGLQLDGIAAPVQQTREKAEGLAGELYQKIEADEWQRGQQRLAEYIETFGASGVLKNDLATNEAIDARLGNNLTIGINAIDALALFISQATSPADRRVRQLVALLATGQQLDPPPNFRPNTDFRLKRR